ncbi:hypothetical protein LTR36_006246 [Oleoguttula mirabilis]|uniref:Exonuclease domain-containing protein n=1 Tax=Oleoguttula mirabilis TaxID=1507867 RepID=A0AAV9JCW6_9PEZI|nr:hypothetical protein LTR36_006246 [Oleoguttula mirabilis]
MSAPRPRTFVYFPDYFEGFDRLDWDENHTSAAARSRGGDEGRAKPILAGAWLISCGGVSQQYGSKDLRLRINRKGRNASVIGMFDCGVLEGVMHFDTKMASLPHDLSDDAASDEDDSADDAPNLLEFARAEIDELKDQVKRVTETSNATRELVTRSLGSLADAKDFNGAKAAIKSLLSAAENDAGNLAKRKRRKTATLRSEIQLDRNKENRGYIEFTDADCLEFCGVISGAILGSDIPWSDYKIGDRGTPFGRSWENYSEEEYELERVFTLPVTTISAKHVSYQNGVRYIAQRPRQEQPKQTRPVQGFGDRGPTGWRCRAHQLQPRLGLVTPGKPVAVDCEGMILDGRQGDQNRGLGRVSVTKESDQIIYDTFVYYPADVPHRPDPQWLDLGVNYKDIKPENGAQPIGEVLENVQAIFDKSGFAVGHAFHNDMKMLRGVSLENVEVRDTQLLPEYTHHAKQGRPSLKDLSAIILKRTIQVKDHSSVEDARATMRLYQVRREDFERQQGPRTLPPVITPSTSGSDSQARSSSNNSSDTTTTSSSTSGSASHVAATATVVSTPIHAGGHAPAATSTSSNLAGRVVALPNIAAFAKGRVFDYQTSRYT